MTIQQDVAKPLHIDFTMIEQHVDQGLAVEAARAAAELRTTHRLETRRLTLPLPGGWMRVMACAAPALGLFGYKEFHLAPDNSVRYAVHVFDSDTGEPLGVVDGARITTLRTAATAAVAVERIVGAGARIRLGVVGTGAEARAGVRALAHLFDIVEFKVTSRNGDNRERFVDAVRTQVGLEGHAVEGVQAAAAGADVVYVATNSNGAVVVTAEDVDGVPCISSIGSTLPQQRELAGEVIAGAADVLVDTWDALEESGDLLAARDMGLDQSRVRLLGDVLTDSTHSFGSGSTLYKSIGSPEQDLVLAGIALREARLQGYGRRIEPLASVKQNLP